MADTAQRHTPAPWAVGAQFTQTVGGYKVNALPIHGSGSAIASVWNGTPRSADIGIQSEGGANARLIAAAPDMAAALRALQTVDRLNVAEWSAAMRAVDAALAKATGE